MVIMVSKDSPYTIGYKISHSQKECFHLKIPTCRRSSANLPDAAYSGPLKVSESKYRDLISLCTGQTPVISNASHAAFFQSLSPLDTREFGKADSYVCLLLLTIVYVISYLRTGLIKSKVNKSSVSHYG